MLAKTTCLHIPPLYEEGTARIMWESSEVADGYELDVHYDEDFETASTGKTWSDIENAGLSAAEIEALNLTWEQIAKLPAQGLSWRNIEFRGPAWSAIDASNMSWQDIQRLPVEFTEFKGEGEKTQAPDQGLAWANIQSSGLSWSEIEALGWSWADFMFQPSIGINWSQMQSEGLSWAEIEARGETWHDFERQAARGLGWGSLDGRFLDWSEIEAKNLTWKQFENLPPDSKTHIAHTVDIPIRKKKAIFRVRGFKDGEYTAYLTSTMMPIIPLFYRDDSIKFSVTAGTHYWILLKGRELRNVKEIPLIFRYSTNILTLSDFAAQIPGKQTEAGTYSSAYLQIISHTAGEVQFKCIRPINSEEKWSGNITLIELASKNTGIAEIVLTDLQ